MTPPVLSGARVRGVRVRHISEARRHTIDLRVIRVAMVRPRWRVFLCPHCCLPWLFRGSSHMVVRWPLCGSRAHVPRGVAGSVRRRRAPAAPRRMCLPPPCWLRAALRAWRWARPGLSVGSVDKTHCSAKRSTISGSTYFSSVGKCASCHLLTTRLAHSRRCAAGELVIIVLFGRRGATRRGSVTGKPKRHLLQLFT